MTKKVLEINGLSKRYGRILAVNDLSVSVEKGQIFGILGPNGSGKTTTLGMVMGIIRPNQGTYKWFEEGSDARLLKRIGTLLETPNFYPYISAIENLAIVAHIKKKPKANLEELLQLVGLADRRNSKFKTYSLGMKQRLAIAAVLIGDPEVLIFDEPTNGLDPEGIKEVRELLIQIGQRGKSIIMASHILDEVEKVCSHVGILKKGNLLATGTVGSIISSNPTIELASEDIDQLQRELGDLDLVEDLKISNGKLIISVEDTVTAEQINRWAFNKGIVLTHLVKKQKSLEEEFLEITRELKEK